MDYKYIEQLLERYWQGETTLEEEEILRTFFCQKEVPASLLPYQSLFVYEHEEPKEDVLGDDFDERILARVEAEQPKARTVTLTQRLKPLFRAAAIVAIFLTLGNAIQMPFTNEPTNIGEAILNPHEPTAVSVALGDSAVTDTMRQSNVHAIVKPEATLLK